MKSIIKSIQDWIKERRIRRNLKKDQALRERCADYIARNTDCNNVYAIDDLVKYIKSGKVR